MGLGSYSGGGGKTFLPGDEVHDGMSAILQEQPIMEEKDFGNGPETAPTFVMKVEALSNDDDNKDGIFEWTPGKFAVGFLLQHLGAQEADWNYPVEGHFERRMVQTKFGRKKALHFIPDGITEEAGSPKTQSPGARTSTTTRPASKVGSPQGRATASSGSSKPTKGFVCNMPVGVNGKPCGLHFATAADLGMHMGTH